MVQISISSLCLLRRLVAQFYPLARDYDYSEKNLHRNYPFRLAHSRCAGCREGRVIERRSAGISSENVVPQLATIVDDLRPALGTVVAIGVALPGLVNR